MVQEVLRWTCRIMKGWSALMLASENGNNVGVIDFFLLRHTRDKWPFLQ